MSEVKIIFKTEAELRGAKEYLDSLERQIGRQKALGESCVELEATQQKVSGVVAQETARFNELNAAQAKAEATAKRQADAARQQAEAQAQLRQRTLENTEQIKAEREIREGTIDATKRSGEVTEGLTGQKSRLGQAIGALNRAMPGLGSSLRLLLNPYTAVAGAIAFLIQKNISLRAENKAALEQAEKDFDDWSRSVQEKVTATKQRMMELTAELRNVGSAAQSVKTDLDAMLEFTSMEEAGDMEMLDAEESVRMAEAKGKYGNDPAGLARAEFEIRKEFTGRRRATKTKYEDARIAAKEKFTADAAAREAAAFDAAQKAKAEAEAVQAPESFEKGMADYDAETAKQEAESRELLNKANMRSYGAFGGAPGGDAAAMKRYLESVNHLALRKSKRGDYEGMIRSQLDTKAQANEAAKAAKDHYGDLVNSRKTTERELDNDYAKRDIRRGQAEKLDPLKDRASQVDYSNTVRQAADKNNADREQVMRAIHDAVASGNGVNQKLIEQMKRLDDDNKRIKQELDRMRRVTPGT